MRLRIAHRHLIVHTPLSRSKLRRRRRRGRGGRPLGPGFLKDLGFEKPSWLPDFGGGDDKPAEEPKAEEEAEETEEAEAASE